MSGLDKGRIPARHPGGRTCKGAVPLALLMLPLVMWKHRRELADEWRKGARR